MIKIIFSAKKQHETSQTNFPFELGIALALFFHPIQLPSSQNIKNQQRKNILKHQS